MSSVRTALNIGGFCKHGSESKILLFLDPVLEVNNNKTYSFLRKFIDASDDPATTIALWGKLI